MKRALIVGINARMGHTWRSLLASWLKPGDEGNQGQARSGLQGGWKYR